MALEFLKPMKVSHRVRFLTNGGLAVLSAQVEAAAIWTAAGKEKGFVERFYLISEKKRPHYQVQSI